MAVDHHPVAAPTSQELIEGQAGHFALDVPERRIDGRDGAHRHRAPAPIRSTIKVLPDVLDHRRIAADERGDDVLGEVRRDGELAPVQRRVAQAVNALVGFDPEGDEVASGTADNDAASGNLHGGEERVKWSARRRIEA